jgi:hypothetical protein
MSKCNLTFYRMSFEPRSCHSPSNNITLLRWLPNDLIILLFAQVRIGKMTDSLSYRSSTLREGLYVN